MAEVLNEPATLDERLEKIRSSRTKLQNQQQTGVVLSAVEDTLKDQKSEFTPTAYFAALLSLLSQYVSSTAGIVNKEVASAVVYLLDLVTPHVPAPLLRSKFVAILTSLAPALSHGDADAPFLRSSIGCLVSLLIVQDATAWALPQSQISPRRAVAGLLQLAVDHRPKVRKRAQEGLTTVLQNGPPSPSVDHPAADMCAETALRSFADMANAAAQPKKQRQTGESHEPALIHTMQLVKTVASASGGWPSKSLDSLCEVLFTVAKSKSEFLTMSAFDVFEAIFEGLAKDASSVKLPRLLEAVTELQPSSKDTQLLPPWIAIISRGYDVSAQMSPIETFRKLPDAFKMISKLFTSTSYNIRVSAAECLISFCVNCIPASVLLDSEDRDEMVFRDLSKIVEKLLNVKYHSAWMETFTVLGATLEAFRWRSVPLLNKAVTTVGELRSDESFSSKQQADEVLSKAIRAMGPEAVLQLLPLNLVKPGPGKPGRAWMLPLIRDSVSNTDLAHFKTEFLPLSEMLFQRVLDQTGKAKTMETKIFETLVQQVWASLPGYCDRCLDITKALDQGFAELLSNVLYQQPDMRINICKALQILVDSTKATALITGPEDLVAQGRISKADAQMSLQHIAAIAPNLLAVLFNIYCETNPQYRGPILACIDSYLSIIPPQEISDTFARVAKLLDDSVKESAGKKAPVLKQGQKDTTPPPTSHALMDIVVAMAVYLPREGFPSLFQMASAIISQQHDAQLQKKAYKLIPRLALSEIGKLALNERSADLQQMILATAENAMISARRDRLNAMSTIVDFLPSQDLYFVPSLLPEVILATKEANERARTSAFDLLVQLGEKMSQGGIIDNSKISHMPPGTPPTTASLEEYFTMLSAGLAGSTPHMISASVTAITRALYHFKSSLSDAAIVDLIQTMDLFLKSPSREIVGSVLGFVKVCIISIPTPLVTPRLPTMIPHLIGWSHEHKAHFKAKVKHILERVIRRFGVDIVERYCPEDDRKLITNIRKTRERRKRKKTEEATAADGEAGDDAEDSGDQAAARKAPERKSKFDSEFDEALYGSDSSLSGSEDDDASDGGDAMRVDRKKKPSKSSSGTFIVEDASDPLDLLSRKALGAISSTRPSAKRAEVPKRRKVKTDEDGKLDLREEADAEMQDADMDPGDDVTLEGGINAYVDAIRGRDAAQRGRGGRLKFSTKREKNGGRDDEDDGEVVVKKPTGRGAVVPRGGAGQKPERRGLEGGKTRGGRVEKRGGDGGGRGFGGGRGRGASRGGSGGRGGARGFSRGSSRGGSRGGRR